MSSKTCTRNNTSPFLFLYLNTKHATQSSNQYTMNGVYSKRRRNQRKMIQTHEAEISVSWLDNEKKTMKVKKRYDLMSYCELPEYMKDNEFVLRYYRAEWPLKKALFSLFQWHNETINVWTHFIGFLLFLGLTLGNVVDVGDLLPFFPRQVNPTSKDTINTSSLLTTFISNHESSSLDDASSAIKPATRWPFFVFLGGSMFCLLSSSICHLFSCHSHNLNILLLRLDYVGIAVMIITSFFPPIYYIFQCDDHAHWHFIYLGGITLMGIFTIITLLSPSLSTAKFRGFRAMLFTCMGLFGIFPALHATVVNWDNPKRNVTLTYEAFMALFYLGGTGFYVTRIPERLKPGWFDVAGHSHQIFHVFVVLGALAHYAATLVFLEWRDRVGCQS